VADLPAAVTDTHALLFHSGGGRRLGPKAASLFQAAEAGEALIYVPMAVLVEVTSLTRTDRFPLRVTPEVFFTTLFANASYQPFDLSPEQVFAVAALRFNRDPWDLLIVAAAQVLGLPLITRDAAIVASRAVKVIW
jgi:PIN domain nuclease of toxin-antitoxin system